MNLLADTSAWSLALRRDAPAREPAIERLHEALSNGDQVLTTGLVLQELLQGFAGPTPREAILERFAALPLLVPDRADHVAAAAIRDTCRRAGIQVGTIEALLTQLCLRRDLLLRTTDRDFELVAAHTRLRVWVP